MGSDLPESPRWRDQVVLDSASTPQAASTPVPEEPSPTPRCPSERRRRADAEADFAAQFSISSEGGLRERSPRDVPSPPRRERSRSRSPPRDRPEPARVGAVEADEQRR
eukprot:15430875-Alexandrium_andersonii.AAC.1